MHESLVPPDDVQGIDVPAADWKMEYYVMSTLRALGHDVHALGLGSDLALIRRAITDWKPQVAFNLLEDFHDVSTFDQNVVSYLELMRQPYTGCNPRGLMLARDKAIAKKLLAYHRIPIPEFAVFARGRAVKRPRNLPLPVIVKSLTQEASTGISQASVVADEARLKERVAFIHESIGTDAIAERYVDGRELYVGVLGNQRLEVFPVWEMYFTSLPDGARPIATDRVKWSVKYQTRHSITTGEAKDLPETMRQRIQHLCKRVYRILWLSGYARLDLRLDAGGRVYVIEANPNPQLAKDEDFADSAEKAGVSYEALLQRILNLGLRWRPEKLG